MLGQAQFVRAGIVRIGYPIPIGIGATTGQHRTRLSRAVVALVYNAVAVLVRLARRGTARGVGHANLVRARIIRVWDAVTVPVGTTG